MGRTVTAFKTRCANYKRHIQTAHKGCEIATHFSKTPDQHEMPVMKEGGTRSAFLREYNEWLGGQIDFILIDQVTFPANATTAEKEALMVKSEGYWQTQLRT